MARKLNIDGHIDELVKRDFRIFMLEKWKISSGESAGERYSLKNSPCLLEIIKDDFPFQVKMKAAQAGLSEIEIARVIWKATHSKGNILYTFPAGEQMQDFVDARPRNAILNNDYLIPFITGSLNLKKFSLNNNQIYFRGVQKRRQIISVDASVLEADEIDAYQDEGAIYTLNKRLGAASNPYRNYFSTPSFHSMGVALYYYGNEAQKEKGSDQRVWTIRCECCGQWNENLLWEENILDLNRKDAKFSFYEPNVIIICRHCKKPLDRLANGQWVAKITSNSDYCHGYHISKLFSPKANLNDMYLDSMNPMKEQEFYNSDLGLPFEPVGSRLLDANIDSCRGRYQIMIKSNIVNYAGVDRGNILYGVCGHRDEDGKFKLITANQFDDIDELSLWYKDFNIKVSVLDMNPDKDEAMVFQKQHLGVWLAYFSIHLEKSTEKFTRDYDESVLAVNRTLMMMLVSDLMMEKSISLPIDIKRVKEFYEHLKSPIKAQKIDAQGNPVTFYPKTKNPDHYYFCLLYWLVALQLKTATAQVSYRNLYV